MGSGRVPISHAGTEAQQEFRTDPTADAYSAHTELDRGIQASYLYQRSHDGAKSEDAISWRVDPRGLLSFAVADGVSGSYYGSIAANFLAEALTHHLPEWVDDPYLAEASDIDTANDIDTAKTIRAHLDGWAAEGRQRTEQHQRRIEQTDWFKNLNPILRDHVQKRQRSGSQAVFFCGCIDYRPGPRQSLFVWMGNVQGQAFGRDRHPLLDVRRMADDGNRWTTASGCHGEVGAAWIDTAEIQRILVFTDGLKEAEGELVAASSETEGSLLQNLRHREFSDDASLLNIWLSPRATPTEDEPEQNMDRSRAALVAVALGGIILVVTIGVVVGKALEAITDHPPPAAPTKIPILTPTAPAKQRGPTPTAPAQHRGTTPTAIPTAHHPAKRPTTSRAQRVIGDMPTPRTESDGTRTPPFVPG